MNQTEHDYARAQADGADNIAPTTLQGQQGWQYAQTDDFFSPEEQVAVFRQQLEPHLSQIEAKLAQVGYPAEHLAKHPEILDALFSGQQTNLMTVAVAPNLNLEGKLRIVMTEAGPDIRITPAAPQLMIPNEVEGVRLSKAEQQELKQEGALSRPLLMTENGSYVPTFLRVDHDTNTVELWRIKAEQLPTKLMGIDLTKDQQQQLVSGHAIRLNGLLDSQGEPFNATVNVSAARQTLQFGDFSRLDVSLKPDNAYRQQLSQNDEGTKTDVSRGQERAVGAAATTHHQSETIKQLLEMEPLEPEKSAKLRR